MTKKEILKKLKQEFIEEDTREPFHDREYVEETIRLFNLLTDDITPEETKTDEAITDIISDIFRHFGEDELELLIRQKRELIKDEN